MPPVSTQTADAETKLLPINTTPRLVLYAQTHHVNEKAVSLLPLITQNTGVTHVILAALHLNDGPGNITLNDHAPDDKRFDALWGEVKWLQGTGVKVCLMLGGAAKGSWARLSGSESEFNSYFQPVIDLIKRYSLSGLDLDIEEDVPLSTPIRTINRLHHEFGDDFIITLAPTCTALLPLTITDPSLPLRPYHFSQDTPIPDSHSHCSTPTLKHLSGFSYPELMASEAGSKISWFNAQLYCGWGDASKPQWYDAIIASGWPADKVVFGVVTTERNGPGYVPLPNLLEVLRTLRSRHPGFGGVMGWEYFNSGEGDPALAGKQPWDWVKSIGSVVRSENFTPSGSTAGSVAQGQQSSELQGKVKTLTDLGFERAEAVHALNITGGNVELAAGILFDQ